jgi:hypothetical protein
MFGVVLWSDEQEQKAVIWCEDHGDLAFYRNADDTSPCDLDAGDWVHFDMTMERSQRLAHNPKLIHEGVYPDLAVALSAASENSTTHAQPARQDSSVSSRRESAQVIPIAAHRTARRGAVNLAHEHRTHEHRA